ncbi:MAG TPA: protoporphyrinogen oxidase, partial [Turneriella sp.]|nr:protoporphyrinogen oxidase [Turneriella sp.]
MSRIAVVGGGISGLAHAYYWKKKHPKDEIILFEAGKLGGNIQTQTHDGALLEPGPDSYLERSGLFTTMIRDLGIESELLHETKNTAKRYVVKDGYLVKAPTSPGSLFFSSLLFFPEKIKMFLAMGKKFSIWPTITLFDAARNVLGFSTAEYLASPMARGIYGSEAEDIEFSSIFPELFKKITETPKLKIALKEYSREKKEYWQNALGGVSFERGIYNFKGGLITWVNALEKYLSANGVSIIHDKIARIQKHSDGKHALSSKAKSYNTFDKIIFTVGRDSLAYIWREADKELSRKITEVKHSPINVVYAAWNKKDLYAGGYGFLVPRKERISILGCIFASNVFPGRIKEDYFLTKTMVSGDGALFKDEDLSHLSQESLARVLRIKANPLWTKVFRQTPGIPRYAPGYGELKREIFTLLEKHEGVHFAGW